VVLFGIYIELLRFLKKIHEVYIDGTYVINKN